MTDELNQIEKDLIEGGHITDAIHLYQKRTHLELQEAREVVIEYLQVPYMNPEEKRWVDANRLGRSIKMYRERTGLSLSVSKLVYDHYKATREGSEPPKYRYIKITNIVIMRKSRGDDTLMLQTELPEGVYPFEGKAVITMNVLHDRGKDYCDVHFPNIPVEFVKAG